MALLIVHHNTLFNLSDHMTQYIKTEFKESNPAKYFSCGQTRTAAIGEDIKKDLIKYMNSSPFSLMIDGSNGAGLEKMFPISIHIFDVNCNWIMK